VSAVAHRSPFRYPGGKSWLVPRVRQWLTHLPRRPAEFVEPLAGGASVGLSALFENLVERLTLIELDADVAAVWQTMVNGQAPQLAAEIERFRLTPESVRAVLAQPATTQLRHAVRTLLKNRVHYGGILAPGAGWMKHGESGRGLASRWYPQTLKNRLLALDALKARISFHHGDGLEFLTEFHRCSDYAFLIDPPYTVAGRRLYTHADVDPEAVFGAAARLQGEFLMTYNDAPLIWKLAQTFRFDIQRIPMRNRRHELQQELLIGRDLSWLNG
jgi:DNA adenine methylase